MKCSKSPIISSEYGVDTNYHINFSKYHSRNLGVIKLKYPAVSIIFLFDILLFYIIIAFFQTTISPT